MKEPKATPTEEAIAGAAWYVVVVPFILWLLWEYALAPLLGVKFAIGYFAWVLIVFMIRITVPKTPGETVTNIVVFGDAKVEKVAKDVATDDQA